MFCVGGGAWKARTYKSGRELELPSIEDAALWLREQGEISPFITRIEITKSAPQRRRNRWVS